MTEHALLQIIATAIRIDQRAIGMLCDCVDGQVATLQVLFQRDIGRRVN